MYTQQEYEVDVEYWEQHRNRLREMFLEGQTPEGLKNPRRLDGLRYKKEDDWLLKQLAYCLQKLNFSKYMFAKKMADAKEEKDSRPTKKNGNKGMGLWHACTQEQAIKAKQQGSDVRCTGVKTWEVFE
jgi:hypothetical protein